MFSMLTFGSCSMNGASSSPRDRDTGAVTIRKFFASRVGADVELTVVVVGVVLVTGLARQRSTGSSPVGSSARSIAHFGRRLRVRPDEDHRPVERPSGADVEQLVLLLVDEVAGRLPGDVPPELVGSFRDCVFGRVEDASCCPSPRRPSRPARCSPAAAVPIRRSFTCRCTAGSRSRRSNRPGGFRRR